MLVSSEMCFANGHILQRHVELELCNTAQSLAVLTWITNKRVLHCLLCFVVTDAEFTILLHLLSNTSDSLATPSSHWHEYVCHESMGLTSVHCVYWALVSAELFGSSLSRFPEYHT